MRPYLQPPVYLSGAPINRERMADACESCADNAGEFIQRSAPVWGVIGGAFVGALALWAVPKVMDRILPQLDPNHGENVNLEIED